MIIFPPAVSFTSLWFVNAAAKFVCKMVMLVSCLSAGFAHHQKNWSRSQTSDQMCFIIPPDWLPAFSPSPAQHAEERGFSDRRPGFYGAFSRRVNTISFVYTFIFFTCASSPVSLGSSFCRRTDCTSAAREPRSWTISSETCTATFEVTCDLTRKKFARVYMFTTLYTLAEQMTVPLVYFILARHGNCSHDTVAEHNPGEKRLPLQGRCFSFGTSGSNRLKI